MTTHSQGIGAISGNQSDNRPWTAQGLMSSVDAQGLMRKVDTVLNLSQIDFNSSGGSRIKGKTSSSSIGSSHSSSNGISRKSSSDSTASVTRKVSSSSTSSRGSLGMGSSGTRPHRASSDIGPPPTRRSTDFRLSTSLRRSFGSASALGHAPRHIRSETDDVFLEKYQQHEVLGEGSYGKVTKVSNLHNEVFASKAIQKTDADKQALQMLDLEIHVLKHLPQHDSIVKLIEVYETPQKTCLILELCEGNNLEILHAQNGSPAFQVVDVATILEQLASGIAYIHDHDIVHRDLKLENVMVKTKGCLDVKICDFGLCAVKGRNDLQLVCGTPIYMAPEVLCDLGEYSTLCDLWSIGVMVFRMLTADVPFMPTGNMPLLRVIAKTSLPSLCERYSVFKQPNIKSCLLGLLQSEPSKRLTAKELMNHPWISANDVNIPQQNVFDMMRDSLYKADDGGKSDQADGEQSHAGNRTLFRKNKSPRVLESISDRHQAQRSSMIKAFKESKQSPKKQAIPGYMRATNSSAVRGDGGKSNTPESPRLSKANVLQVRLPPLRDGKEARTTAKDRPSSTAKERRHTRDSPNAWSPPHGGSPSDRRSSMDRAPKAHTNGDVGKKPRSSSLEDIRGRNRAQ